jgi:hypothetical protein
MTHMTADCIYSVYKRQVIYSKWRERTEVSESTATVCSSQDTMQTTTGSTLQIGLISCCFKQHHVALTQPSMFGWPCISTYICIINQHDALFIFTLLNHHASTCFGPICGPSSGGRVYNVANGTCFTSKSTVGGPECRPAHSRLTSKTSTIHHTYTYYLLMMGHKRAQNM